MIINGRVKRTSYNGSLIGDKLVNSATASEITSGVSRRKPTGWIPPTSYFMEAKRQTASRGKATFTVESMFSGQTLGGYTTDGILGGSTYPIFMGDGDAFGAVLRDSNVLPTAAMLDQALIKARLKMKTGDVNLGVAFAERKRTANLVTDTALQLVCSMRKLRRGNFRGAASCLGVRNPGKPRGSSIPQRWLELQYGWRPLLSDVYGSVDALSRQPSDNWIITGKGVIKEKIQINHTTKYENEGSPAGDLRVSANGWRGVHVRIDAVPQNDLLMSLASLGITNPALIGWELVPFSFVVDWFLPIGSYLESLDAMLGYGPSWTAVSRFSKYEAKVYRSGREISRPFQGLIDRTSIEDSPGVQKRVYLDRAGGEGVPLPTVPRLRDGRSLTRMANALSLMAQVFGGRK